MHKKLIEEMPQAIEEAIRRLEENGCTDIKQRPKLLHGVECTFLEWQEPALGGCCSSRSQEAHLINHPEEVGDCVDEVLDNGKVDIYNLWD